ncbi:MAG: hypothetical protein PQJ61_10525 [Spirochaetales bacterium]|uniref:Uncharacterized protein n=1 Tax=Candidatus Thalassospirochaeta sargassi TaxID=3119039 RepID=A0AAJ1IFH9_9SPIO|nr:hypothetical protein [Spirochaetales bacterium]
MKLYRYFLLIIIIISFYGCGTEEGGLFYSLEQETEITNGNLSNEITIGAIERNADYYFVAAGNFYYREAASGSAWPENEDDVVQSYNPDDSSESLSDYDLYLTYDMILVDDLIYAVYYSTDGTDFQVFSLDTAGFDGSEAWSGPLNFDLLDPEEYVVELEVCEDKIFFLTATSATSYNIKIADVAGFDKTTAFFTLQTGLYASGGLRVDYDSVSDTFWIVMGNNIFTTDGESTFTDITDDAMAAEDCVVGGEIEYLSGEGFKGVVCAETDDDEAGTEVYITSKEGVMLKYIGGEWTTISNQYTEEDDEDDPEYGLFESLHNIVHIEIASEGIDVLLAGSDEGYYEMSLDDNSFDSPEEEDTDLTTENQFSIIDMSDSIITSFYLDTEPEDPVVFGLGLNAGLWINSMVEDEDGDYRDWDVE